MNTSDATAKQKSKRHPHSVPLTISDELKALITEGSSKLEFNEQDTIRLAMKVGFKHLAAVNWDLAALVEGAVNGAPAPQPTVIVQAPAPCRLREPSLGPTPNWQDPLAAPKPEPTPEELAASRALADRNRKAIISGRPVESYR